jgi:hypothetical protein
MQPINGISLERYADLGAAVAGHENDPEACVRIVGEEGVSRADWEAAKAGWTARMQDMSLMGRVATAYMPMHQAALARRKGSVSASYDDFVAVSASIKVYGPQVGLQHCGVSMDDWTQIAGHWNNTMSQNMMAYSGHPAKIGAEEARIRGGGAPRQIQTSRGAPGPAAGQNVAQPAPAGMGNPAMQQAAQANAAINANPLGFAAGQAAAAVGVGEAINAGSSVHVRWADGNSYSGTVNQAAPGQYLVQFENGSMQWVGAPFVTRA